MTPMYYCRQCLKHIPGGMPGQTICPECASAIILKWSDPAYADKSTAQIREMEAAKPRAPPRTGKA